MANETGKGDLRDLTAQITAAYVSGNSVETAALPELIQKIYVTLDGLGRVVAEPERPVPAVSPKKSIFPDYIVCLEDGKKLKMLKRHLKTAYNLTPDEYRERWGLPHDYPMVAPNYASHRSSLARKIGLGTKREE
ncbi:transcriptional regulator, MucR family [Gluconacetobacter diazotrophicus PA1 5]|uniref:ROS/MUCR transcriptional regulator protein n=2 Tax=Gluconacetobacter diazotrophicus TaxID=33996 RepID=A9HFC1_GLUDA|nr:MucR family transcriptional regulator [Gluconacetobacter diazotrophicus]ACI51859.1 transcriptional regulator, MucR family [Gluconacetobacter diazotrophicus PA1 5]MBB2155585.1 MucR family transcriptional regulator [Gluconacetobacter diazotrophicus]TWB11204.1 MucR family transcriptional regulator [Gluconacetobacter diazotrophicus]CAP55340.1 ROS/MUCR transcriptional regulator protein [Gluconacetobacter diazotrophicus PA1 5]